MDFKTVFPPSSPTRDIIKKLGIGLEGPWIAGGSALRVLMGQSLGHSDIDIFFNPNTTIAYDLEQCVRNGLGSNLRVDYQTRRLTNYRWTIEGEPTEIQIQFINVKFDSVEQLLADFDFTVCQFATNGDVVIGPTGAFDDLWKKRLVFNPKRGKHPDGTRVVKYLRRFRPGPNFFTDLFAENQVVISDHGHMSSKDSHGY